MNVIATRRAHGWVKALGLTGAVALAYLAIGWLGLLLAVPPNYTSPFYPAAGVAMAVVLGLESYFTVGPDEIRAWTIPVGATAPQAAGVIHTDFEKGFIRAEVYNFSDLMELKSEPAIKAAGRMRSEGKSYVFQEGDIAHFLFNT